MGHVSYLDWQFFVEQSWNQNSFFSIFDRLFDKNFDFTIYVQSAQKKFFFIYKFVQFNK